MKYHYILYYGTYNISSAQHSYLNTNIKKKKIVITFNLLTHFKLNKEEVGL